MIPVIFKNSDFIAVDKTTGISVHNTEQEQNLLQLMQNQLKIQKLFPVHRLDKETSGVQILALHESAARDLSTEFQNNQVIKLYEGILRGQLNQKRGSWNQPVSDKAEGRKNPSGVGKDRVPCQTEFEMLNQSRFFTHCRFNILTGRQHQIRKHSAIAGHAIVGDPRYGDEKYNKKIADLYRNRRMFLHCTQVTINGHCISSSLPAEFELLLQPATNSSY